jgi:frataxin-like iron-binding protein CyaY
MEIWKDIPNYEGIYQVSDLGRVKSFRKNKVKILKQLENTRGYFRVGLYDKNLKNKTIVVHSLVAMAFLGHKPNKKQDLVIDHINNNKLDNRASNLQIITNRQNSSKQSKGSSKYIGVHWSIKSKKWRACIAYKNRTIHLGLYENEKDAAISYKRALLLVEMNADISVLYPKKVKSSKYKGVYLCSDSNRWRARISKKNLGSFKTENDAYMAVQFYLNNSIL